MPRHVHVDTCIKSGGPISKFCTCPHCTLCVCKVCGCYEGSLTTDCPGVKVDMDQQEKIYKEGLDYKDAGHGGVGWYTRTEKDKGWPEANFEKGPLNLTTVAVPVAKTIKMNIFGRDRQPLAELHWTDGKVDIASCTENLKEFFQRTIEHGLSEWVGPAEDPTPRHTVASDYVFLERVGGYLKRQTGFIISLRELETLPQ
jgi:hypothetical protein